ncbi:DDE_4 domain-containing protein [Cephalotus follicularis]|uniref:DDE_4 domain-containing protein n=1 Tax=Cephalotus follicularis TaxID=3775 RepID=A0A1Q3CS52_CEPFO|nr:DDE_4 domain-containing protein [Cephalotus follicularis]
MAKPNNGFPFPPPSMHSNLLKKIIIICSVLIVTYLQFFGVIIVYNYYPCDIAYTYTRGFMTAYRKVRYWLGDFRHRRAMSKKEKFNHAHAKLRNVIERTYEVLKARFLILSKMAPYPFLFKGMLLLLVLQLIIL